MEGAFRALLVLAGATLPILPGRAAEAPARCLPLSFMSGTEPVPILRPGAVVGGEHAYFLRDATGCPATTKSCRLARQPYLLSGDTVAAGTTRPGFVCVHFSNGHSETDGWLPADQVRIAAPAAAPPLVAWAASWRLRDNTIRLEVRNDRLFGTGTAIWQGAYTAHTGDFEAEATPDGTRLELVADSAPGGCRLSLTLVGRLLAVIDNWACGGANVTFSGLYVRER